MPLSAPELPLVSAGQELAHPQPHTGVVHTRIRGRMLPHIPRILHRILYIQGLVLPYIRRIPHHIPQIPHILHRIPRMRRMQQTTQTPHIPHIIQMLEHVVSGI